MLWSPGLIPSADTARALGLHSILETTALKNKDGLHQELSNTCDLVMPSQVGFAWPSLLNAVLLSCSANTLDLIVRSSTQQTCVFVAVVSGIDRSQVIQLELLACTWERPILETTAKQAALKNKDGLHHCNSTTQLSTQKAWRNPPDLASPGRQELSNTCDLVMPSQVGFVTPSLLKAVLSSCSADTYLDPITYP